MLMQRVFFNQIDNDLTAVEIGNKRYGIIINGTVSFFISIHLASLLYVMINGVSSVKDEA